MRILVVDDNEDFLFAIRALLMSAGHEPYLAHDMQAALEICRVIKPDFVFVDINLNGVDGYHLAETLRGKCGLEDIPIWALSAYADDREKRLHAGIVGHIQKPITCD